MDKGMVSVIVPCFNGAAVLRSAIVSIINQTYKNIEVIIVDDGSIDTSKEVAISLTNQFINVSLISFERNQGVAEARNAGIRAAKGRFIAFLDCDDQWLPNKLWLQIEKMHQTNTPVCHADYFSVDLAGSRRLIQSKDIVTYEDNCLYNHIGNLTGIYDAWAIGKFFQPKMPHEDYAMWCDILRRSNSIRVKVPVSLYTRSPNSISANKLKSFIWYWQIQRNYLGFSVIVAVFHSAFFLLYQIKKILQI